MLMRLVYGRRIGRRLRSGNRDHRRPAGNKQPASVMVDRAVRLSVFLVMAITPVAVSNVAVAQAEPMP